MRLIDALKAAGVWPEYRDPVWKAIQEGHAVPVRSSVLNEVVYWVRDESVMAKLQEGHPGAVIYNLGELQELLRSGCTPELLRPIHEAKKILGGVLCLR
jgi:hypothetical protein